MWFDDAWVCNECLLLGRAPPSRGGVVGLSLSDCADGRALQVLATRTSCLWAFRSYPSRHTIFFYGSCTILDAKEHSSLFLVPAVLLPFSMPQPFGAFTRHRTCTGGRNFMEKASTTAKR
jgi:hypothetical protein